MRPWWELEKIHTTTRCSSIHIGDACSMQAHGSYHTKGSFWQCLGQVHNMLVMSEVLVGWNYHNLLCFYSWDSTLCHICKERTEFNTVTSYPVFTFGKEKLLVSINVNITKTTKQKQDDVSLVCFKTCSSETNMN